MSKEQWSRVISAVLVLVVTVLAIFGYDVVIQQPREQARIEQAVGPAMQWPAGESRATGTWNVPALAVGGYVFSVTEPITVTDAFTNSRTLRYTP